MPEALHPHLVQSEMFGALPAVLLRELEAGLELVTISSGDVLVRQGDAGDALFVLVSGALDVSVHGQDGAEVLVDRLEPGASVGEMALLAGQERTATVTASAASSLVKLARADFERLMAGNPELRDAVIRQMEPRLQRVQLGAILQEWLPDETPAGMRELQESVSWIRLAGGEVLYQHGDAGDGMYILVSGRLRILVPGGSGEEVSSGEVARGASIGEDAVLGDSPRTETVIAIRDSQLVRLDRELVMGQPRIIAQIARNALARASARAPGARGNGVRTIALVPVHDGAPVSQVAEVLARQLPGSLVVDPTAVDERFAASGAAQTGRGEPLEPALVHWLNEMEARHSYLILVTERSGDGWSRRSTGLADQVLLVANASAGSAPGEGEAELGARRSPQDLQLVLVQPDDALMPSGTAVWLDGRPGIAHHHLRLNHDGDAGRLARRLAGVAVGIVLSGGGARGYVHLGLIRALEELGIPVDLVAGTSMGALVGGAYATSLQFDFCYQAAARFGDPKKLLDKTLPLVALAESRSVTETIRSMFGDRQIEDLWIPFACVSANLTRAEPVIHERGPLWEAVRASTAIPGVFTPVVAGGGDVLVDGGIMNNYPVDVMRERIGTGFVIGSNAESASRNRAYEFGYSVSGWRVLLDRILPGRRRRRYPSIIGTLMRATSVSSKHLGSSADALADVVIRYPAQDFGNLEFDRFEALTEIGFEAASAVLSPWWKPLDGRILKDRRNSA